MTALSHALRMEMFRYLMSRGPDGAYAGEIADRVGTSATAASFHFKELHRAGLILANREGRFIRYAIRIETVRSLFTYLLAAPDDGRPRSPASVVDLLAAQLGRFQS